jgi:hypothetical protein
MILGVAHALSDQSISQGHLNGDGASSLRSMSITPRRAYLAVGYILPDARIIPPGSI